MVIYSSRRYRHIAVQVTDLIKLSLASHGRSPFLNFHITSCMSSALNLRIKKFTACRQK